MDRFRALLAGLRPQTVFGTEEEADLVGEVPGAEMVVKLGPRGVRVGGVMHAAAPVTAVDATGAGDAFAAGLPARRGQPRPGGGRARRHQDGRHAVSRGPARNTMPAYGRGAMR